MKRDFLTMGDLAVDELQALLDRAAEMKSSRGAVAHREVLDGRAIGLIFEKPSTRTRVSFEVGIQELGGDAVVLQSGELQLGRGETVEDTARVLSRYLHGLVVRTFAQSVLETLATAGTIPVVNALSDAAHPCQALADLLTVRERKGRLAGVRLAYLGDGNNVAVSLLRAGAMTGMHVTVAAPAGYAPPRDAVEEAQAVAARTGAELSITDDPHGAAADADVVYTDVWASMGQEAEQDLRAARFRSYQLDAGVLDVASPDAIVLHCLPAHRGEEITADVIDGPRSAVWDQAENRLHVQKALLAFLLGSS